MSPLKLFFALGIFLILSGCVTSSNNSTNSPEDNAIDEKTIQFQSADGVTLVGTYWENNRSTKPPLVLVHQLGRDRHSFDAFAQEAYLNGYSVLWFDLRGHGQSTRKGTQTISYTQFNEIDYQLLSADIWKAKEFLHADSIMVVGASIGANAALQYASEDITSKGVILLSLGTNYQGLDVSEAAKQKRVPLFVIASSDDTYAAQSSQSLFTTGPLIDKKLLILTDAGHGTDMLVRSQGLHATILEWLDEHA